MRRGPGLRLVHGLFEDKRSTDGKLHQDRMQDNPEKIFQELLDNSVKRVFDKEFREQNFDSFLKIIEKGPILVAGSGIEPLSQRYERCNLPLIYPAMCSLIHDLFLINLVFRNIRLHWGKRMVLCKLLF